MALRHSYAVSTHEPGAAGASYKVYVYIINDTFYIMVFFDNVCVVNICTHDWCTMYIATTYIIGV